MNQRYKNIYYPIFEELKQAGITPEDLQKYFDNKGMVLVNYKQMKKAKRELITSKIHHEHI